MKEKTIGHQNHSTYIVYEQKIMRLKKSSLDNFTCPELGVSLERDRETNEPLEEWVCHKVDLHISPESLLGLLAVKDFGKPI